MLHHVTCISSSLLALRIQDRGTSLASNQVQYSLLYRTPEQNGVKRACEEGGTSLIAYSPLAQGLLTGVCLAAKREAGKMVHSTDMQ